MCVTAVFSLMSDTDISLIAESRTLHFTSSNSSSAEDTDSIFVAIYVFIFAVRDNFQPSVAREKVIDIGHTVRLRNGTI